MATELSYPLTALHFSVDFGGQTGLSFSEVSGLTAEVEVVEYRGGFDPNPFVGKQPGLKKAGNVTLKRGIMDKAAAAVLYERYAQAQTAAFTREEVTISLLNSTRGIAMTWTLTQAWPVKIEGPGLKSTGTDVAIESVELACEAIKVTVGTGS